MSGAEASCGPDLGKGKRQKVGLKLGKEFPGKGVFLPCSGSQRRVETVEGQAFCILEGTLSFTGVTAVTKKKKRSTWVDCQFHTPPL